MSRTAVDRALVSSRVDTWLVGGLAVVVWCVAMLAGGQSATLPEQVLPAVYWTGAVLTAAHFGLSYHLAYRAGLAAVRDRPVALLAGPLLLLAVLGSVVALSLHDGPGSVAAVTAALITLVYLTTTWHYVKQVYGVGRIAAAYRGIRLSTGDVRVLRYGLYPLWFAGAGQMLVSGKVQNFAGYRVGYEVLPQAWWQVLRFAALGFAVPIAAVFVRLRLRSGTWPAPLLVAPYLAAFLWIGLAPGVVLTALLLAPFHALQYLAIGHRAEVATARPDERGLQWWLNIFAGAACGGLLLGRWAPQWLDQHVSTGDNSILLFGAAFFVFLNLHHYLIDASIWRSKGALVKALVRAPAADVVARQEPAGTAEPITV